MNQDETNSNRNQDPHMHAWIEPELEARVVAWVAGEASAFECAELERLVAEKPELALFKQRIEVMHGLIADAVAADREPLRLSDERRAKLLATIGPPAVANATNRHVMQPAKRRFPHWTWRAARVYYVVGGMAAACLVMLLQLQSQREVRHREVAIVAGEPLAMEQLRVAGPKATENENARAVQFAPFNMPRVDDRDAFEKSRASVSGQLQNGVQPAEPPSAVVRDQNGAVADSGKPRLAAKVGGTDGARSSTFETDATPRFDTDASVNGAGQAAARTSTPLPSSLLDKQSLTLGGAVAGAGTSDTLKSFSTAAVGSVTPGVPGKAGVIDGVNSTKNLGNDSSDRVTFSFGDRPDPAQRANGDSFGFVPAAPMGAPVSSTFGERATDSKRMPPTLLEEAGSVTLSAATASSNPAPASPLKGEALALSAFEVSATKEYNAAAASSAVDGVAKLVGAKEEQKKKADLLAAHRGAPDAETSSAKEPVSTFSLHVSDVSFRLAVAATAALERGENSKSLEIRAEEFYNAFDYGDPAPSVQEKVGARIEQSAHPVLQQRNLLRIAIKVPATGRGAGQPLRLTVLLDTSGSMEREDRRVSVRRALEELIALLGPNDRVTLIGFARQPRLLAEAVPGHQAGHLVELSARTPAEGGTNLEEALKLAGELAVRHRLHAAQNRIVLLTDGAANLGDADPARLATAVEKLRQQHIAFDACGIGLEGVGDNVLEALTRKGDGRYYVIERPEAADAAFARQLAGAFRPAAENVKLQVRFNPSRVGNYRLIGFDQHRLREEDFRNDQVDAAELAAEEAATALYQVEVLPQGSGEVGEVYVRFRDADTGAMVERSWTIRHDPQASRFDLATPSLQLAGVSALVAEKLSESPMAKQFKLGDFAGVVNALRGHYGQQTRVQELVMMYARLRRITGE